MMNIHITKEQFNQLDHGRLSKKFLIGSKLYGHDTENSDTDYLYWYYPDADNLILDVLNSYGIYPNLQLQYKDLENKVDHVFTSVSQFYMNLFSGDSQINVEVALFYPGILHDQKFLRSYKILRGLIGVAKRDMQNSKGGQNIEKVKHALKMIYLAKSIYLNETPSKDVIKDIFMRGDSYTAKMVNVANTEIASFRDMINSDLNNKLLFSYSTDFVNHLLNGSPDDPTKEIIKHINTTIFKYD